VSQDRRRMARPGTAELKQKDFGITPISLRRHVRVKIELRLGFDIVGR
jgi:hypothetical protein